MSMTILWIAVAVGIAAALVKWTWPRAHTSDAGYGSVSHQWVAEHRLAHADDQRR